MEIVFILILVVLVFSVTIGIVLINRDDVPDAIVEEKRVELEEKQEEFKDSESKKSLLDRGLPLDEELEVI